MDVSLYDTEGPQQLWERPLPASDHTCSADRPFRILLAEDNETSRAMAKGVLKHHGHSVITADKGYQAYTAFQEQPFDLVLMDIYMPEMDGHETAMAIRRYEAAFDQYTPIIALTSKTGPDVRDRCIADGMDEFKGDRLPFVMSEDSLIEIYRVLEQLGNDLPLLFKAVRLFRKQLPFDIAALEAALESQDAKKRYQASHRFKGALRILPTASLTS